MASFCYYLLIAISLTLGAGCILAFSSLMVCMIACIKKEWLKNIVSLSAIILFVTIFMWTGVNFKPEITNWIDQTLNLFTSWTGYSMPGQPL